MSIVQKIGAGAAAAAVVVAAVVASVAPAPSTSTQGFYPGYANASGFTALETLVGHKAGFISQFTDASSQDAFMSSVWGEVVNPGAIQSLLPRTTLVEAVPLTLGLGFGASSSQRLFALSATAGGSNDNAYRVAANYLNGAGAGDAIIRLGWEFDGDWMPWSAVGNEAAWVRAYQHVVGLFRTVSPGFRFDWNGDPGLLQNETAAYPGDAYVDIVGLDIYDKSGTCAWRSGTWVDPAGCWAGFASSTRWQESFAAAHGKQISFPEWGLTGVTASVTSQVGGDNPTFIQGMHDAMIAAPQSGAGSLAYESYFNEDQIDGNHRINAGWFPRATALFVSLFGGQPPPPTTTSTTRPPVTTTTTTPGPEPTFTIHCTVTTHVCTSP